MSAIHVPFMFAADHGSDVESRLSAVRASGDGWRVFGSRTTNRASANRVLLNGQCPLVLFGDPAGDREPEACVRRRRARQTEAHA
jgi:hypothetical protein